MPTLDEMVEAAFKADKTGPAPGVAYIKEKFGRELTEEEFKNTPTYNKFINRRYVTSGAYLPPNTKINPTSEYKD